MSKKNKVESKKKKVLKKMTMAIKLVKSKKSSSYTFEKKMISNDKIKDFFEKKSILK